MKLMKSRAKRIKESSGIYNKVPMGLYTKMQVRPDECPIQENIYITQLSCN